MKFLFQVGDKVEEGQALVKYSVQMLKLPMVQPIVQLLLSIG